MDSLFRQDGKSELCGKSMASKPLNRTVYLGSPYDGVVIKVETDAHKRMVSDDFQGLQVLCDPLIKIVSAESRGLHRHAGIEQSWRPRASN